jgi:RNA polymerase sigma-70 factor (family 1)
MVEDNIQTIASSATLAAFKGYFDAHYTSIRNFLYFKTGDIDLADDMVQEVFLRLWEQRDTIRQVTVKSLLYSIATNILRNHYKHQKVVYNFVAKNPPSDTENEIADFEVQQKEFNETLTRVIAEIPENSRMIFLMNRIEDLTYEEIAERLNLSVKAIEKRMHKALAIIKEKLSYKI